MIARWLRRTLGSLRYRRGIKEREEPRHAGSLHRQLDVPEGQVIPKRVLRWAAKQPGKVGARARLMIKERRIRKRWRRFKHRWRTRKES